MVCAMDIDVGTCVSRCDLKLDKPLQIMSLASPPYPNISNVELYRALVVDGARLPLPAHCPAGLYDVLLSCWELDPQRRPPFHKIHRLLQVCPP